MLKVALHYFKIDRPAWLSCAAILVLLALLAAYEVNFKPYLGMTEMLAGIVPMFAGIVWAVALFSKEFETKSVVWSLSQDLSSSKWFFCRIISPLISALIFGVCVWGIVEVSQLRSDGLNQGKNMMSYSYIAGHALYPAVVTVLMVSVASIAGVVFKKSIPAVAVTFALGLLVGTTGASWLNPLLPVEKGEFSGPHPDPALLPVPGDILESEPIENGKYLVEFYPNSAFWQTQTLYTLMWLLLSLILLVSTLFLFKWASKKAV
ncbi:ABC transporter permease [Corynebacterium sp. p3-SID1241]|uniref:ABC transporter permease n=1 Tax=Corynebacterium sp. p3-SID1241 TaxID=2916102 RepID=UPI0021A6C180|nr:ABC transporter permease [Corynebacterium sp. p3-SID1241]MCT1428193.1 ABC transporter permease [Corynebacterium sp. p3-SID1241]